MKTRPHFPSLLRAFALKRLCVVVLAVALLATIAPLGVSSHAQSCSMPCCSGGSCSTGACDVSFDAPAKKVEPESHCEHGGAPTHGEIVEASQAAEIDSSELCGAEHLFDSSAYAPLQPTQSQQSSVNAGSFSKPCSSDCCAGAAAFLQLRRSRDTAILGHTHKSQTLVTSLQSRNYQHPVFLSLQLKRLSPPRAPPYVPFNA